MADGLPDIAMDDSAQGVPTSADDAHHNVAPGATSQQTPAGLDTQLMDTITKEVSQAPVTTPVTAPAKPTTAGFLLEESEEEDATDPHLNGDTQANGSGDTIPTQAQDVQISSAATQDPPPLVQSTVQTASDTAAAPTYLSDSAVAPATSVDSLPPSLPNTNAVAAPEIAATPVQNGIASIPPTANVFKRLPHDKVGQLEDRISDEPRADPEAWFSLIAHYKEKDQLDNVRQTYDRFLEVYPTAAYMWLEYLNFEQEQDETVRIDNILNKCLLKTPNVDLWLFYLNVLRRRHPLIGDDGKARAVISGAFDFAIDKIGIDPESGRLWREYIEFIKSGPGNLVANSNHWQDQQKLDLLRKAYHKAVAIPTDELVKFWKEYDNLENAYNRAAARKLINERSPHYMTAKVARTQLDERMQGLDRRSLPVLPPLPGFAGDDQFGTQVRKWREWIMWEKSDELVLKQDEDLEGYRKRIDYAYKQATMALRFYPEIWFEAAAWCFEQGTEHWRKEGEAYLDGGIIAVPESPLLALRKADVVEISFRGKGESEEILIANGNKLDVVYEKVHGALYALKKKYQEREQRLLADVEEHYASLIPEDRPNMPFTEEDDDDEEEEAPQKPKTQDEQKAEQIAAIKSSTAALQDVLKNTITYVWIAKMHAFRRVQGASRPREVKKGFRGVFGEARTRGWITSDVFIVSASLEHFVGEGFATKIWERGLKLFSTDEAFILGYIKHLINNKKDIANAKAVFETSITKIEKNDNFTREQKQAKCRPLLSYMHTWESDYGDLVDIQRIEKRMADLYPQEPEILRFVDRFALPSFDGVKTPLAISPVQIRPKASGVAENMAQPFPGVEEIKHSPQPGQIMLGPHGPYVASPKRPLEDSDDGTPNRKFLRTESPLKGAAGRRIANAAGAATTAIGAVGGVGGGFVTKSYVPGQPNSQPAPLPAAIFNLLSVIPPATSYNATRFDPFKFVEFMRTVDLSRANLDRQ